MWGHSFLSQVFHARHWFVELSYLKFKILSMFKFSPCDEVEQDRTSCLTSPWDEHCCFLRGRQSSNSSAKVYVQDAIGHSQSFTITQH